MEQGLASIKAKLRKRKITSYSSYLNYPMSVRRMIYTINWIERLNKEVRKVTRHVNSFPNEDSMLNLVFMVLQNMEQKVYSYPITGFCAVKEKMEKILHP